MTSVSSAVRSSLIFAVVLLLTTLWFQPVSAQTALPQAEQAGEETTSGASLEALLDVLRDDAARAELIAELEATTAALSAQEAEPVASEVGQTLARRVATTSTVFVEDSFATLQVLWRDLTGVGGIVSGLADDKIERISEAWLPLVLTVVSTVGILWILTRGTSVVLQRFNRPPGAPGSLRTTFLALARNAATDAVILALAYAVGYVLAYFVFGTPGNVLIEQSLYLNAFLVAGVVRIGLRAFVLPDRPAEAISHLSQPIQTVIYRRITLISWLLVYGLSVGVPVANAWTNLATGRSLRVIFVTVAAIVAIAAIRRVSRMVSRETEAERVAAELAAPNKTEAEDIAASIGEASVQAAAGAWNKIWPWLAGAYVAAVWIIAITRPRLMADMVWAATLKTLIAGALLALAFRLLRSAKGTSAPIIAPLELGLPELTRRLNGLAPFFVRFCALMIGLCAIALLVDAWTVFDLAASVTSQAGAELIWRVASAALVVGVVVLIWAVISSWIDHRLSLDLDGPAVSARSRTLLALFRNAFTVAIFVFGVMIALSQLGIDIAPLLAGAGVLGLAIGFGAQKLVQDIITGIFIQLENAINEGDVVTVSGISGAVEKLTIRSVGVRDLNGIYHIVPFSSVDTVSNFMRGFGFHVEVVGISYNSDVGAAKAALQEAFERLRAMPEHGSVIIGDLDMHGVVALSDSSVDLRVRIRTLPGKQWGAGRAYTEIVKTVLDERGIEIPFPHRKLVFSREEAEALTLAKADDAA